MLTTTAIDRPTADERRRLPVLGVPIDVVGPAEAVQRIARWAAAGESRTVCLCNAHSVVTAGSDPKLAAAIRSADLATPDGTPVAWMLRRLGASDQTRVSGPDLMLDYCEAAQASGEPMFLYGSTEPTLLELRAALLERWPALRIVGHHAPPFRPLSADEEQAVRDMIHASGARTVWVGLGCPKQEAWMQQQRGHVRAVMIGVGAAFDFHAGRVRRAPRWMRDSGLEWLHRLFSEPRRLWRRYLETNVRFLLGAARQLGWGGRD
jgi:N-acetylglucosaminyldiphosphoundecaprenol N-acetyl-beta-D-mannosaminyltransferase